MRTQCTCYGTIRNHTSMSEPTSFSLCAHRNLIPSSQANTSQKVTPRAMHMGGRTGPQNPHTTPHAPAPTLQGPPILLPSCAHSTGPHAGPTLPSTLAHGTQVVYSPRLCPAGGLRGLCVAAGCAAVTAAFHHVAAADQPLTCWG